MSSKVCIHHVLIAKKNGLTIFDLEHDFAIVKVKCFGNDEKKNFQWLFKDCQNN